MDTSCIGSQLTDSREERPRRLLVVEDDHGLRSLIVKTLSRNGYDTQGVATGQEAVARIESDPDLVLLLDQQLPDMTGSELIDRLRQEGRSVPFVVMTGQGNEQLAVEMMKRGAADYLVKDLHLIDLLPSLFQRLFRELDTEQRLRRAEENLRFQFRFEKVVAEISSSFVSLPAERLDQGINHALKVAGEFFQAERSYLLIFSSDGQTMTNTHEWCAQGVEPQIDRFQNTEIKCFPWWMEQLRKSDHIYIPEVTALPPEAEAEKKEFLAQHIRSLLCMPIRKQETVFGYFGFETVTESRHWAGSQVALIKIIAELLASAYTRHLVEKKYRYLSFHDSLTGLYNRAYLEEEMARLDTPRQLPISIVMADLNGLKVVNDTYGHPTGDELLKSAAGIMKQSCRNEDIVARWGGDEFLMFLTQTSLQEARSICTRLGLGCRQNSVRQVPVSMAVGVATKEIASQNLIEVLRQAEDDMYQQKLTESRSTKSTVLKALLKTLAAKSYETEAHTRAMQVVAQEIGEAVGLPDSELKRLDLLITLHDIGKINLPEDILTKKGSLTAQEWESIKKHPETGFRIARATEQFAHVADDILSHHERWDGSGYPRRLRGDQIPYLARITALADAYEVMTNGRPYKKPLSREEAIREFQNGAGSQFDPFVTDIFLTKVLDRLECGEGSVRADSEPGPLSSS